MTLLNELQITIRHMEIHNTYKSLSLFVDEKAEEIVKITNPQELKEIIKLILYYTNLANCCWLENEIIRTNKQITNIILEYIMKEDIYGVSPITYSDFLCNLNLSHYPDDFCSTFLEKDLDTTDILIIESILYKIDKKDKTYYKQMLEKYKNKKFTTIEINEQISIILQQKNYGFIKENINYILNIYPINAVKSLYKKLKKRNICIKETEIYILQNLDTILNKDIDNINDLVDSIDKNSLLFEPISYYLKNNIETIIKNSRERSDIYDIKKIFDKFPITKPLIKDYINNHKDEVIDKLYSYSVCFFINNEDTEEIINNRKNVKEILKLVIEELCEKEHVEFSDIEKIGEGAFSKVYKINNKVLKLGIYRDTMKIPNNPYNIKPLMRRSFNIDNKKHGENLFIEITEYVKTIPNKLKETEKEKILYDLYKKQRDIGIEWRDIKLDNVGILTKDNIQNWPDELGHDCKAYGLIENKYAEKIHLKKGEYVVLDGDLQYPESVFRRKYLDKLELLETFNDYWIKFYMKYEEEKKLLKK